MYELLSKEIVRVDPEKACQLLRYNNYDSQRGVKSNHLSDLTERMKQGQFLTGHACLAMINGDTFLVDGQHTLNAVIISKTEIDIILEKVLCNDHRDVALLYQQMDGGVSRSFKDYVKAEQGSLGLGWADRTVALVASAAVYIHKVRAKTKGDRVKLLKHYIDEGNFVNKIFEDASPTHCFHLRRAPVVAVMMLTYKKAPMDAEVFWTAVKNGEMLTMTDPAFKLRDFLLKTKILGASGAAIAREREFEYKSVYTWNAYRKRKKVKIIKYLRDYPIQKII